MKTHMRMKMFLAIAAILCFGIAPAWGAKPGAIIHVNASATGSPDGTSWETAFPNLQDALDDALPGNEIWVAAGTYTPGRSFDGTTTDPRKASFSLKSGVKIYGGFAGGEKDLRKRSLDPGLTILSGDIGTAGSDTDNSYHVVYANGVTGAVLDGFTVTLGRGEGLRGSSHAGAGMYNDESSLTVAHCIFKDNQVAVKTSEGFGRGGGMYNYNSAPIVRNCTFIGNQAGNASIQSKGYGGGMYNFGHFGSDQDPQWPVIIGCTFSGNIRSGSNVNRDTDGGGGMYNDHCSPTVDRCTFDGNYSRGYGGAMFNHGANPIIITNSIFTANRTSKDHSGGAIFNFGSDYKILNCTFYRNGWSSESPAMPVTYSGGAIAQIRHGGIIANTLFVENGAMGEGGAIYLDPSYSYGPRPTLYNCLFYDNIRWYPTHYLDPSKHPSHVDGVINADSVNNLYDIDPLLIDPADGDFRLHDDSPGIDKGTTEKFASIRWLPMPATDFEGNTRFKDGDADGEAAADIGAYEYVPNLPDLGEFIQDLCYQYQIDTSVETGLLAYVDDAQAARDQDQDQTAIDLLTEMINVVWTSGIDPEAAQSIEMKILAVLGEI